MNRDQALQIARIPGLLVLLWPLAAAKLEMARFATRLDLSGIVGSGVWPWIVAVSLAYVIVAVLGRHVPHPPGVLAAEGVVAGALAVVPPFAWVQWFGFAPAPGIDPRLVMAAAEGLLYPFAIMWLGIVIVTAARQWRQSGERSARTAPRTKAER